jgi:hypothetical protein
MHSFEEYKGFLEVAFDIHPCYILWPSLPLRQLLESWSTVLSKVEVATDNFFLAKEHAQ